MPKAPTTTKSRSLPPNAEASDQNLSDEARAVCIRTFLDPSSAELARNRLQMEGIRVRVIGAQTVQGSDLPGALRGIGVWVDEANVEDALALIGPEHNEEPFDEGGSDPRCSRCHSIYLRQEWSASQLALGVALFGLPFRWMKQGTYCAVCGHLERDEARVDPAPLSYRQIPRRAGNPVFRLRRGQPIPGVAIGLVAGFILSIFDRAASAWFMILGPISGGLLGNGARSDVCSKPGCRAPLEKIATECPTCHGTISGVITHPGDHFVRKEGWHRGQEAADG